MVVWSDVFGGVHYKHKIIFLDRVCLLTFDCFCGSLWHLCIQVQWGQPVFFQQFGSDQWPFLVDLPLTQESSQALKQSPRLLKTSKTFQTLSLKPLTWPVQCYKLTNEGLWRFSIQRCLGVPFFSLQQGQSVLLAFAGSPSPVSIDSTLSCNHLFFFIMQSKYLCCEITWQQRAPCANAISEGWADPADCFCCHCVYSMGSAAVARPLKFFHRFGFNGLKHCCCS